MEYDEGDIETWPTRKEAARIVGKAPSTLIAWEKRRLIDPVRDSDGNRRYHPVTLARIAAGQGPGAPTRGVVDQGDNQGDAQYEACTSTMRASGTLQGEVFGLFDRGWPPNAIVSQMSVPADIVAECHAAWLHLRCLAAETPPPLHIYYELDAEVRALRAWVEKLANAVACLAHQQATLDKNRKP